MNLGTHREPWYQDLSTKILVPRSWYQDQIIYGEPERRSLSVCRGAREAAGPPPECLGGWKPPGTAGGLGAAAPQKKKIVDPEPDPLILGKGETGTPLSDKVFERLGR